jgi:glycerophosphoryl diester phosphodiesterase
VNGRENLNKMFALGVDYVMSDDPAEAKMFIDLRE